MKNAPQERNIFIIAQNACTVNYPSYKKRGTSVPLKRIMNIVKKHENENEEKPSLTVYLYYSAQTTVSSMAHKKTPRKWQDAQNLGSNYIEDYIFYARTTFTIPFDRLYINHLDRLLDI